VRKKHIHGIVRSAEQDYKSHKSRDLYRKLHVLSTNFKPNEKFLRNEDGTLITNNEDKAKRWVDYFDQLINCGEPRKPFYIEYREPNIVEYPETTIEEIIKQIKILKNNKSPGEDKITGACYIIYPVTFSGKLLKRMRGDLVNHMH